MKKEKTCLSYKLNEVIDLSIVPCFRDLEEMPFDHEFDTPDGRELLHATGREMLDTRSGIWWCEYMDSYGNLYYGN